MVPQKTREAVESALQDFKILEYAIYARGETAQSAEDFESIKSLASSALHDLEPTIGLFDLISSSESKVVKSWDKKSQRATLPSTDSYASPKRSLIKNAITESSLKDPSIIARGEPNINPMVDAIATDPEAIDFAEGDGRYSYSTEEMVSRMLRAWAERDDEVFVQHAAEVAVNGCAHQNCTVVPLSNKIFTECLSGCCVFVFKMV